jgi:hypothetical protein
MLADQQIETLDRLIEKSQGFDDRKTDYRANANKLSFDDSMNLIVEEKPEYINGTGNGERIVTSSDKRLDCLALSDNARGQLYAKLGAAHYGRGSNKTLPTEYLDRFDPEMRSSILNWTLKKSFGWWLIRGYDTPTNSEGDGATTCRAILDGNYPRLSNTELMRNTRDALAEKKDMFADYRLVRPVVTPDSLSLRIIWNDSGEGNYRVGAILCNDETGQGRFEFMPLVQRTSCENSIIIGQNAEGKPAGVSIHHYSHASAASLMVQYALAMSDVLKAGAPFVNRMIEAEAQNLENFRTLLKGLIVEQGWEKRNDIEEALDAGAEGSRTLAGLVNAVTYAAHVIPSFDENERVKLEMLGGQILNADSRWFAKMLRQGQEGKKVKVLA